MREIKRVFRQILVVIAITLTALNISSCTSKEEQAALNQIAKGFRASISTKMGYVKTSNKKKESGKYIQVTIEDPATISADNHGDLHYSAAKCAYAFYLSDLKDGKNSYDFIRIVFNIESDKSTFEYSYATLKRYHEQFKRTNKIVISMHDKSFHEEYFNAEYIKIDDAHKIHELIRSIQPDSLGLIGFKEADALNIKQLAIQYHVVRKTKPERLTIVTDLDTSNAPIIGVTLNDTSN